jgi:hypothetical protein
VRPKIQVILEQVSGPKRFIRGVCWDPQTDQDPALSLLKSSLGALDSAPIQIHVFHGLPAATGDE